MLRHIASILLIALVGCAQLPMRDPAHAAQDGLPAALAATVVVLDDGHVICSGVAVDGLIVTASHCLDTPGIITVRVWDGAYGAAPPSLPVRVLYNDTEQDVAVVATAETLPYYAHMSPTAPRYGQKVVIIGHPLGLLYTVVEGVVSSPERDGALFPNQHWFQTSAPVAPGNSGGPAYNTFGEVLGVVSFRAGAAHLAGVVHTAEVKKALAAAKAGQ